MSPAWWVVAILMGADPAPLRWVPVVFERAVWLPAPTPTLHTDLGQFSPEEERWRRDAGLSNPFVPFLRPPAAAMAGAELLLARGEGAVTLSPDGSRLLVIHGARRSPRWVPLPGAPAPPRSVRLLWVDEAAWLIQVIAPAGDALLGAALLRIPRDEKAVGFVHPAKREQTPVFAGALPVGDEVWLFPDSRSERQDIWVRRGRQWRREPAPTERSVLMDVRRLGGDVWLAYSDGVLQIRGGERRWYPLEASLISAPEPMCGALDRAANVRGRWVRGENILGWGVGELSITRGYPMDGVSCAFFTNASGSRVIVGRHSVVISLKTDGSFPVAPK